jgi:hypothetical protein
MEEHPHLHLPMARGGEIMIDWENFLNIGLSDYGFFFEGYFGDVYIPWRTLILAVLVIAGLKAWRRWRDR